MKYNSALEDKVFVEAITNGNFKKASYIIDKQSRGLDNWSHVIKDQLRQKFPKVNQTIVDLSMVGNELRNTNITDEISIQAIKREMQSRWIAFAGYDTLRRLIKVICYGTLLSCAIKQLANSRANSRHECLI